jgi:hypothetical protein
VGLTWLSVRLLRRRRTLTRVNTLNGNFIFERRKIVESKFPESIERRKKMEDIYKEVYFDQYCKNCIYEKTAEKDEPCYECLNNPVNLYSHKPVNFEKK